MSKNPEERLIAGVNRFNLDKRFTDFKSGFNYVKSLLGGDGVIHGDVDSDVFGTFTDFSVRESEFDGFFSSLDVGLKRVIDSFDLLQDYELRIGEGSRFDVLAVSRPSREQETGVASVKMGRTTPLIYVGKKKEFTRDLYAEVGVDNVMLGNRAVLFKLGFPPENYVFNGSLHVDGQGRTKKSIANLPYLSRNRLYGLISDDLASRLHKSKGKK